MNEEVEIRKFINWAIANIEEIADIRSVPREDVYDAIAVLRGLLPYDREDIEDDWIYPESSSSTTGGTDD